MDTLTKPERKRIEAIANPWRCKEKIPYSILEMADVEKPVVAGNLNTGLMVAFNPRDIFNKLKMEKDDCFYWQPNGNKRFNEETITPFTEKDYKEYSAK